jgi:methyl-accepting chemotaxis protein
MLKKVKFKNLRTRLIISVLIPSILIFIATVAFISQQSRIKNYNDATLLANSYATQFANLAKVELDAYLASTQAITTIFENFHMLPMQERRQILADVLKVTLEDKPELLSVWSICETNSIDTLDDVYKNTVGSSIQGNFRYIYYRDNNEIKLSEVIEQDSAEVLSGKLYSTVKNKKKPIIVDPYYYSYTGNKDDEVLETNIVTPILSNGEFKGVVGIDFPLESFQEIIRDIKPFENS